MSLQVPWRLLDLVLVGSGFLPSPARAAYNLGEFPMPLHGSFQELGGNLFWVGF